MYFSLYRTHFENINYYVYSNLLTIVVIYDVYVQQLLLLINYLMITI